MFLVLSKSIALQYTSVTELIYNQFTHFTEAAIISCTFEEFGWIALINIHMSVDILQLFLWIALDYGDVSWSHYVNFDFVSGHFLRR